MEYDVIPNEPYDAIVVGAGISGVSAAYHLQKAGRSFVVLDAEQSFGGTWLTHSFPGIRSDSDLYTFGYGFKPWVGPPIAQADSILNYMGEVVEENGLRRHMRFGHRVTEANFNGATNRWTVRAVDAEGNEVSFTARFLHMCQGYFRQREGYLPDWAGLEEFRGRLVHAQVWPEDLDLNGKKVVVIGSGATAATIVPNIAEQCAHVTMLQRSPTYFAYDTNRNELADRLRKLGIDEAWIHEIVRRDLLQQESDFAKLCRENPEEVRKQLLEAVEAIVGPEITERHFTPSYRPWQQRLAFLPDGDLLHAIASGKASVVTDQIDRFGPEGLLLNSGERLDADVVVAATGFNMNVMGDIRFSVDGAPLDMAETVTYRGMMFTGVPNLAWVFGYFRSSWTLRSDMLAHFVCRLLDHMDQNRVDRVEVALPPSLRDRPRLPWIDPNNFNPSYLTRALPVLPRRLDHPDWQHTQDYASERELFPTIDLSAPEFRYGRSA